MKRGILLSIALLAMVMTMTGCKTFYQRWKELEPGMTKRQVLDHMEEDPTVIKLDENGDGEIIWRMHRPQPAIAKFKGGKLVHADERYKME